jgi:hypothetical protein
MLFICLRFTRRSKSIKHRPYLPKVYYFEPGSMNGQCRPHRIAIVGQTNPLLISSLVSCFPKVATPASTILMSMLCPFLHFSINLFAPPPTPGREDFVCSKPDIAKVLLGSAYTNIACPDNIRLAATFAVAAFRL